MIRWLTCALLFGAVPSVAAQRVQRPPSTPQQAGWRTYVAPADRRAAAADTAAPLVRMPPGWHLTTRVRTLVLEDFTGAAGRYRAETEFFFFPGPAESWIALVIGGKDLGTAKGQGTAFLLRRDGQAAVHRFGPAAHDVLADWVSAPGAVPQRADSVVKNVIRVSVEPDSLRFSVNGTPALALPNRGVGVDGNIALLGSGALNAHITTLDITYPQAPRK